MAGHAQLLVITAAKLSTVSRVGGAAILGAVIGAVVAGIWYAAETVRLDFPLEIIGRILLAAVAGAAVLITGSAAGFAWLQVRPLPLTVPAATVAGYILVRSAMAALSGGRLLLQPWPVIVVLAADLSLVALAAAPGWPRLAGLVLLAALIVTARALAVPVRDMLDRRGDRAEVEALQFRPVLPGLAGYKISSLHARDGRLSISLVPDDARPDRWGAYPDIALTIFVAARAEPDLAARLARARDDAAPAGPGQWVVPSQYGPPQVITQRGDAIAVSSTLSQTIPVSVLAQAAASLSPATVDAIMAVWHQDRPTDVN